MKNHLYELLWEVVTDTLEFIYREFRVFCSDVEAGHYGKVRELDLNDGASIRDRAWDGYCFRYLSARRIDKIDGFVVTLAQ
jgi:hypothetical protein